jgi:hypothetical protein
MEGRVMPRRTKAAATRLGAIALTLMSLGVAVLIWADSPRTNFPKGATAVAAERDSSELERPHIADAAMGQGLQRAADPEPQKAGFEVQAAQRNEDITGGVPGHRRRIDDYIQAVGRESYPELVENLNRYEPLLISVATVVQDPSFEFLFQQCLANRRLARIVEELQSLPKAKAQQECRRIFDQKLRIHSENTSAGISVWSDTGKGPDERIPIEASTMALGAAVFLSAQFCDVSEVLRQLDAWTAFGISANERMEGDPAIPIGLYHTFQTQVFPERLFVANLLTMLIQDRCPDGLQGVTIPSGLELRPVPFLGWDAHTNHFDFTHQKRGVPVDETCLLKEVHVYHCWWTLRFRADASGETRFLSALRRHVEAYGA